jgi:hypothetical protein
MNRDRTYRYRNSITVPDSTGSWISGNSPFVDTEPHPQDIYYEVRDGDRLDALTFRVFGDASLWWVISEYNDLFWFQDLTLGQVLRIPSYEHLYMDLLR